MTTFSLPTIIDKMTYILQHVGSESYHTSHIRISVSSGILELSSGGSPLIVGPIVKRRGWWMEDIDAYLDAIITEINRFPPADGSRFDVNFSPDLFRNLIPIEPEIYLELTIKYGPLPEELWFIGIRPSSEHLYTRAVYESKTLCTNPVIDRFLLASRKEIIAVDPHRGTLYPVVSASGNAMWFRDIERGYV